MLSRMLAPAHRIAIGGHVRPDGDCVGSCMGLYRYIRDNYPEKEAHVWLEEIPNIYKFLEGAEEIRHEVPEGEECDLFICLDCGDRKSVV